MNILNKSPRHNATDNCVPTDVRIDRIHHSTNAAIDESIYRADRYDQLKHPAASASQNPYESRTSNVNKTAATSTSDCVIRLPELQRMYPVSRTTIYELIKAGKLPRPLALSERTRGWLRSEIEQCIANLKAEAIDD